MMRRFYHCLKLHIDRGSSNHYTTVILPECILPCEGYEYIALSLPSVKRLVSPAAFSFYRERGRKSYYRDWDAKYHSFISVTMCRHWKHLEDVQCHITMVNQAENCKSIRNLTIIGVFTQCSVARGWYSFSYRSRLSTP